MISVLFGSAAALSAATSIALAAEQVHVGHGAAARRAGLYFVLLSTGLAASVLATSSAESPVVWPGLLAAAALAWIHASAPRSPTTPSLPRQFVPFLGPVGLLLSLWIVGDGIQLEEIDGWEGVAWFVVPALGGVSVNTHFRAAHQAKGGHRTEPSVVRRLLLQGWIGGVAELLVVLIAFAIVVAAIRTPSLHGTSTWTLPWGAGHLAGGAAAGGALSCAAWLATRGSRTNRTATPAVASVAICAFPPLGLAVGLASLAASEGYPHVGFLVAAIAVLLGVFAGNSVESSTVSLNMLRPTVSSIVIAMSAALGVSAMCLWLLAYGIRTPGAASPAPVPTGITAAALFLALNLAVVAVAVRQITRLRALTRVITEAPAAMNAFQDVLLFSALAVVVGAAPSLIRDVVAGGTYVLMILIVSSIVWIGVRFAVKENLAHLRAEVLLAPDALQAEINSRGANPVEFVASWTARLRRHVYWNNAVAGALAVLGALEALRLWG